MPPKSNYKLKKKDCEFPVCKNYNCPSIHKRGRKHLVEVGHYIKITSEDVETNLEKAEVYAWVTKINKECNQIVCTVKLFPSSLELLTFGCKRDFVTENGEIEVPLSALNYVENLPRHLIEESKTLNNPTVEDIVNTSASVISDFVSNSEIDESKQEANVLEKKCFRDFALEFQDFSDKDKFECINYLVENSSDKVIIETQQKTTEYKNNIHKHQSKKNVAQTAPVLETALVPETEPVSAADLVIELLKNIPHTTLEEVVKNPRVGENLENALGVPEQVQAFQEHIQALQEELSRQSENFHRQSEEFLQHSEQVRYQLEQQLEHQSTQMYHQQALIEHQQSVIQNQAVEMDNLVSYSGGEGSDYLVPEVEVEAEAVSSCLDYNSNGYCCYGVNCRNGPHP